MHACHRTILAAALLTAASAAGAQNMSVMNDLRKNCMADAKAHCGKLMGKPSQLMQCLVDNRDKLTPACTAATDRMAKSQGLKPTAKPKAP
jgi:hypothetical protein